MQTNNLVDIMAIERTIKEVMLRGDPCERCAHLYGEHYTQYNEEKHGCAHYNTAVCVCLGFAIRISDLSLYAKRIGSVS